MTSNIFSRSKSRESPPVPITTGAAPLNSGPQGCQRPEYYGSVATAVCTRGDASWPPTADVLPVHANTSAAP